MSQPNLATLSILRWVFKDKSRLAWYARHCRARALRYREFVAELESLRRDVLKTPDGVIMDPETNEALDMVVISRAWNALPRRLKDDLFLDAS